MDYDDLDLDDALEPYDDLEVDEFVVPSERDDRLRTFQEVRGNWEGWLKRQGVDAFNYSDALEHMQYATPYPDADGVVQSDYGEHAQIVSASPENLLAWLAMLISRGISPEGTRY